MASLISRRRGLCGRSDGIIINRIRRHHGEEFMTIIIVAWKASSIIQLVVRGLSAVLYLSGDGIRAVRVILHHYAFESPS